MPRAQATLVLIQLSCFWLGQHDGLWLPGPATAIHILWMLLAPVEI